MTSPKSWTVVVFQSDQTVQAVPTKWIHGDNCLWPVLPQDKLNNALRNCDVDTCWPSHKVRILRNATYEDYSVARTKAKKAEHTSDLSTDTEQGIGKRKKTKPVFDSSSTESEEEPYNKKIAKKLPTPPQMTHYSQISPSNTHCVENLVPRTWSHSNSKNKDNNQIVEDFLGAQSQELIRSNINFGTPHSEPRSSPNRVVEDVLRSRGTNELARNMTFGTPNSEPLFLRKVANDHQKVPNKCNNSCATCCGSKKDTKSYYVITSLLVELNSKVDKILTKEPSQEVVKEGILQKFNGEFPIKTLDTFKDFDKFICEEDNYSSLVSYFSKIGGNNIMELVKRCLAPIMADELAIKYSYLGRKSNENFSVLTFSKVVIDAAEKAGVSKTTKEKEQAISSWLKRANERIRRSNIT